MPARPYVDTALLSFSLLFLTACGSTPTSRLQPPPDLAAHSAEFRREVVKVTDGVWSAVGWGAANSILIEGTDGVIVVDTTVTVQYGRDVLAEFRKITGKPVKAIIYTHSHPDHTSGASAFAEGSPAGLQIYAQQGVARSMEKIVAEFQAGLARRAARMYGSKLSEQEVVNIGLGPELGYTADSRVHALRPNRTFDEELEDAVAGVRFKLVHAPGETDDQLFVWLPDKRVLLPGDNVYRAFPNLYTIRGTTYRDLDAWSASLDRMRELNAAFLVPSHSRPLAGQSEIDETLTAYRDAIRFVYEQSMRMINQGRTPDEIAATLRLPPHLAQHPFLREFYGTVRWSARSVFAGNLGWFDGNATTLDPLPPDEEARRFAEIAGGEGALERKIIDASKHGEHQWVLQLSDRLLRLNPKNETVREARIAALLALGEKASNPNARHYYLTAAHELRDGLVLPAHLSAPEPDMLREIPLRAFFDAMAVNLHAEDALDLNQKVGFRFIDTGEAYTLWVRRGVTEIQPRLLENLDVETEVSAQVFKELLAHRTEPVVSLVRDFKMIKGSKVTLVRFFNLFKPST